MIKKTLIALIVPAAMLLIGTPAASAHPDDSGSKAPPSKAMMLEKGDASKAHAAPKAGKHHRHHARGHRHHKHHHHHH